MLKWPWPAPFSNIMSLEVSQPLIVKVIMNSPQCKHKGNDSCSMCLSIIELANTIMQLRAIGINGILVV